MDGLSSTTVSPDKGQLEIIWSQYGGNPFASSLSKLLEECPNEKCLVWLNPQGNIERSMVYSALLEEIKNIVHWMSDDLGLKKGDKVVLCYMDGFDFTATFLSCMWKGIIPVPVYPPDPMRGSHDIQKFCDIAEISQSKVILSHEPYLKVLKLFRNVKDRRWNKFKWLGTENAAKRQSSKTISAFCNLEPSDLAFIQFTSGSTSVPKGVMVTHGSLLHNVHLCWSAFQFPTDLDNLIGEVNYSIRDYEFANYGDFWRRRHQSSVANHGHRLRTFSWLPFYHDMGLIGFLCAPIICGATLYQLSPSSFIRKPHVWLQAMSKYKCVCCAAPNFAFDLVTKKMPDDVFETLDLSHVCGILSGSEPVRESTISSFYKKFSSKGIRKSTVQPAFGLAEHTLIVTGSKDWNKEAAVHVLNSEKLNNEKKIVIASPQELGESQSDVLKSFISCGYPLANVDVRIVDAESMKEVYPGRVGEIWIRSPSCAAGYYGMPAETKVTFKAVFMDVNGVDSPGEYVRTGDIGFFLDGQLYIAGRIKDMILFRGRNYYPQDIEEVVEEILSIRPGCTAAFSLEGMDGEYVAIAAEVRSSDGLKGLFARLKVGPNRNRYVALSKEIRSAVISKIGLPVAEIWLFRPRSIPKTSSGKIRRSTTRDRILAGTLAGNLYHSSTYAKESTTRSDESHGSRQMIKNDENVPDNQLDSKKPSDEAAVVRDEVHEAVERAVVESAQSVLGTSGLPAFDVPLYELGLDSMAAAEFAELVSTKLSISLEPTLLFNYPTIHDIINFLTSEVKGEHTAPMFISSNAVSTDKVAILGYACNLPGRSTSLDAFWNLLSQGIDAIVEVPKTRWDSYEYFSPDIDAEDKMYVNEGGFIEGAEYFDATCFKISPSEAKSMDPQQRLLLENAYECLYSIGYTKEKLVRANIGVFVGCCSNDWHRVSTEKGGNINGYTAASHSPSLLSNRVSYALGLVGSSMTIDTACSSSLVAIHVAMQGLHFGNYEAAIVSGVNLMLSPAVTIAFCRAGMMAPDARCKTFDDSANGYIRGEGIGTVFIKLLEKARKDGDDIKSIIRGSAVNHGGKSASLTSPSSQSQQSVISAALACSNIKASSVRYIEAHGTGTMLGDPIEVEALKNVFSESMDKNNPIIIGALKTNIGHLEGAAGIAGILKTLLVLQKQVAPPNLHFKKLSKHIKVDNFPVIFPTKSVPVRSNEASRIAGVSSFGFGGTNAHVILEEALNLDKSPEPCRQNGSADNSVAFMFDGLGQHYINMGKYLYDTSPSFRDVISICNEISQEYEVIPLLNVLYPSSKEMGSLIQNARYAEPALYAVQYAMASYWADVGIVPDAVIGVGIGELTAAAFAGAISLEDGFRAALARTKTLASLSNEDGFMVRCHTDRKHVEQAMIKIGLQNCETISITTILSSNDLVLSGSKSDLEAFLKELACTTGEFTPTPFMIRPELFEAASKMDKEFIMNPHSPMMRIICGKTGEFFEGGAIDSKYWGKQIVHTCNFKVGIETLIKFGCTIFVELGPTVNLTNFSKLNTVANNNLTWITSMDPGMNQKSVLIDGKNMYEQAVMAIDTKNRPKKEMKKLILNRDPYPWVEIPHAFLGKFTKAANNDYVCRTHFPKAALSLYADHVVNGNIIMPGAALLELLVATGASLGFKDSMNTVAVEDVTFERPLVIATPRTMHDTQDESLKYEALQSFADISQIPHVAGFSTFDIECRLDFNRQVSINTLRGQSMDEPVQHCTGKFALNERLNANLDKVEDIQARCLEEMDIDNFYDMLYSLGLQYGPRFRTIHELRKNNAEAIARLQLNNAPNPASFENEFLFHPSILDGALQMCSILLEACSAQNKKAMIPFNIKKVVISRFNIQKNLCFAHATLLKFDAKAATFDINLYDSTAQIIARFAGVTLRSFDATSSFAVNIPKELLWNVDWINANLRRRYDSQSPDFRLLVVGGHPSVHEALLRKMDPHATFKMISYSEIQNDADFKCFEEQWSSILFLEATQENADPIAVLEFALLISKLCSSNGYEDFRVSPLWFVTLNTRNFEMNIIDNVLPAHAGLWGFARSLRTELEVKYGYPSKVGCVDVQGTNTPAQIADLLLNFSMLELWDDVESEVILRRDEILVPRLVKNHTEVRGSVELHMTERSSLSNLVIRPQAHDNRRTLLPDHVIVRIRSIGLNFRDVLNVMGLYPGDPGPPGSDCAGTVVSVGPQVKHLKIGDAVFGIAPGCLKTYVTTNAELIRKIPGNLSFEAASALPVAAVTVEYALNDLAKVQKGDRVLIHAISGGVGLVAARFCQRIGAVIYGTCGSEKKKEYMRSIGVTNLASSRDVDKFKEEMNGYLGGEKIDVILNSLTDDYIPASLALLRENGRFMELGKRSIWSQEKMQEERPDVYYETVAIDVMMEEKPAWFGGMLERVGKMVEDGSINAIPLHIFEMTDAEEGGVAGFRFLQRAQHIGKVVIKIPSFLPRRGVMQDEDVTKMEEDKTYVVSGGAGGLGLVFTQWLAEEGVKTLVLLSRRSAPSEEVRESNIWKLLNGENSSLKIVYKQCDVSKYEDVLRVFKDITSSDLSPVRGILHAAGITSDAAIENQSREKIEEVYLPKVSGAWNLHRHY